MRSAAPSEATTFGGRLRYVRGSLSQKTRAAALRVALSSYQHYERDERAPDSAFLARLVEEGWNANWLLTGEGPERLPDGMDREIAAKRAAAVAGDPAAAEWIRALEKGFFARGRADREIAAQSEAPSHSQPLRREDLKLAVQLAEEALDGGELEPQDYAELVALIHDALVNGLPSAQVLAFARPAARGLIQENRGNDRSDVGGPGTEASRRR